MAKITVQHVDSVCQIDFAGLRESGIDCVLFDAEGTITPYGKSEVPIQIQECIKNSGMQKVGLVTNINKREVSRVKEIANQINATTFQHPKAWRDRKPSPLMLQNCMRTLRSRPEKTVMVGDKLVDVSAARRAGLSTVFWVRRHGKEDHWYDTLIYRPFEKLARLFY